MIGCSRFVDLPVWVALSMMILCWPTWLSSNSPWWSCVDLPGWVAPLSDDPVLTYSTWLSSASPWWSCADLPGWVAPLHDDPGTQLAGGGVVCPVLVDEPLELLYLNTIKKSIGSFSSALTCPLCSSILTHKLIYFSTSLSLSLYFDKYWTFVSKDTVVFLIASSYNYRIL